MKICAVIQARLRSTRLPEKIFLDLEGKSVLERVVERVSSIEGLDHIVVALPEGDTAIIDHVQNFARDYQVPVSCAEGSEDDVLDRTVKAAKSVGADVVIRITSDCPFVDSEVSGRLLKKFMESDLDYARLDSEKGYPIGFDTEVVKLSILEYAQTQNPDGFEREHATPYVWRRPEKFKIYAAEAEGPDNRSWRLVVDDPKDYEFAKALYRALKEKLVNPVNSFTYDDIQAVIAAAPEMLEINQSVQQKAMIGKG